MRDIKFYVIGLLIFGLNFNSNAQESKSVVISLTVSPSVGWMSPTNKGYTSDGAKMGIKYGLLMDFRLFEVDNYSFISGFTMNHIGGKMREPSVFENDPGVDLAASDVAVYKLTYIDVPLVIRLKTNEIGYNVFYAVFGSEVGFNVGAKKEYTRTYGSTSTGSFTEDASNEIKLFRSSLVFGLGIQRNISGNTNYRIGLTYHNGLTNVMKGKGTEGNEGKAYAVDGNGVIELNSDGSPKYDRKLNTKLSFIELNLAIVF